MMAGRIVALSGGIGGAKLALGLYRALPPGALSVVVNTGDDFEHLGLAISPDLDTLLYTLAGLDDPDRGWGRRDETWSFMAALESLGGESWFQLGDGDLALHVERTRRLARGEALSDITADFAARWGVTAQILPMSDQAVRTLVESDEGVLGFQDYFVRRRCRPRLSAVRFQGLVQARAGGGVLAAIGSPDTAAIVICPSNPYLSVDPILALADLKSAIGGTDVPVIAVTPIIAGQPVKGPTGKIMTELGLPVSPVTVARHYEGLIDGFVLDRKDRALEDQIGVPVCLAETLMTTLDHKVALAKAVVGFSAELAAAGSTRRAVS